jgi:DNA polymerase-3 subunit delta
MYLLLYGDDAFRCRKTLAAIREQFIAKRDASGLNMIALRYPADGVDRACEEIFASPFLAEKKMITLEGFLQAPAKEQERIKDAIARKPESTVAVFVEGGGAAALQKAALFADLADQKFSADHATLAGPQLLRFVMDECLAGGAAIGPKAAQTLIGTVGTDTWQLHHEARRLAASAAAIGAKEVSEELVKRLSSGGHDDSVFAFLDACVEGRAPAAAILLEELFKAGVQEIQIVSMLLRQFRNIIAAKDLIEAGERDKGAIAAKIGIHPFPAGKAMAIGKKHPMALLKRRYRDLVEIDRLLKTGGGRPKVLLNVFALRMSAA